MTITHAKIINVRRAFKKYSVVIYDKKMELKNFHYEGDAVNYLQELGFELVSVNDGELYFKKVVAV